MEYLVLPGESAYTASEARKVKDRINRLGGSVFVEEVTAVWLHYAHLRQTDRDAALVGFFLRYHVSFHLTMRYCSLRRGSLSSFFLVLRVKI